MDLSRVALFAPNASRQFGAQVSLHLGVALSAHEEHEFEDGEHVSYVLEEVRGKDVFVIHSLFAEPTQSVNDKLCRLLFLLGALRDAGASRVTAALPYLCYARQDNRSRAGEPVTTRYVASLFEAVGVDQVLTLDVHNLAAYQNAFRCRALHLEARELFAAHFAAAFSSEPIVTLSPDIGGIKRMERFRAALSQKLGKPVPGGFMEKYRSREAIGGDRLTADVRDKSVLMIDDMISTGKTIARAAAACRAAGADHVYVAASHGLFAGDANALLGEGAIDKIVVTNSVAPAGLEPSLLNKLVVLDASKLFTSAIQEIHSGRSGTEPMLT